MAIINDCITAASEAFGVAPREILSKYRDDRIVRARHAAMLMARWHGKEYSEIGRKMGRDHKVVIYGCGRAKARADTDNDYYNRLQRACLALLEDTE